MIRDIQLLQQVLQRTMELEHATIPLYFVASASLKESIPNEITTIIRGVLIQEMLHMTLVANLSNAIGTPIKMSHKNFIPQFPTALPFFPQDLIFSLSGFSPQQLDVFLRIELPETEDLSQKRISIETFENLAHLESTVSTIGELYQIIEEAFRFLSNEIGEDKLFCGSPHLQINEGDFYYGEGQVIPVTNLDSALQAIQLIIDEGEGFHRTIFQEGGRFVGDQPLLAHYFAFNQIKEQRHYQKGDTLQSGPTGSPLEVNYDDFYTTTDQSQLSAYPTNSPAYQNILIFNSLYSRILDQLEEAFNGNKKVLTQVIHEMCQMRDNLKEIIRIPFPENPSTQSIPTFEYIEKEDRRYE